MKTLRRNRIIIALVLLLSLLPMGIVKATHVHDSEAISTVETSGTCHSHNGTADNDCPISSLISSFYSFHIRINNFGHEKSHNPLIR